jgi:long-chain acyl-CoA synthetase
MDPRREKDQSGEGAGTIPGSFFEAVGGDRPALLTRDGNLIKTIGRRELEVRVKQTALGLLALGIAPGERVAILHENAPEWIISDLAASSTGAVTVPIYTTLGLEETAFILKDSGAVAIICSPNLIEKVRSIKTGHGPESLGLDSLKYIISTGETEGGETPGIETLTMERLTALGRESGDEALWQDRMRGIYADDPFSIIYTSGTTGRAKGVVLSHKNILSNIEASLKVLHITAEDLYLSYLPVSHIFERMVHHLFVYLGAAVAYSRGFAYVGADIGLFKPTVMVGVPFFFNRVKARVVEGVEKSGPIKRFVFNRAMKINRGGQGPVMVKRFADSLVFKKIRERVAPGLRFFISGGAALSRDTAEFFWALGIPVLEGYGLTETSPVVSVNTFEAVRLGTVGRPIPGVEVMIGDRSQTGEGEILIKGPNVMKGYLNMPEATREAIHDGWFHTGDMGALDEDGFLRITDRKKDLIVTSVGKNVSPQRIETLLRADEYIKEALVYGDGRPHLAALIVPDVERLDASGVKIEKDKWPIEEGELIRFFEKRVRMRLKPLARFEQIKRFFLIDDCLSLEGGEITPTMKVKREAVARRFGDLIERLYEG